MRRVLVIALLAIVALTGFEARASQRRVRPQVSSGQGPFKAIMDLERRKNAALRQMFFGR